MNPDPKINRRPSFSMRLPVPWPSDAPPVLLGPRMKVFYGANEEECREKHRRFLKGL